MPKNHLDILHGRPPRERAEEKERWGRHDQTVAHRGELRKRGVTAAQAARDREEMDDFDLFDSRTKASTLTERYPDAVLFDPQGDKQGFHDTPPLS